MTEIIGELREIGRPMEPPVSIGAAAVDPAPGRWR